MAEQEFFFTMNLSDPGYREGMLGALAVNVLGSVGYQESAAAAIVDHMRGAVEAAVASGCRDCTIHFQVESGELLIVVSHDGHEWRTTRPLP